MQTFKDIITRFDLLYENMLQFEYKLRYLYGFEKALFLSTYLTKKPEVTMESFADAEPVLEFPYDDIYIKALLVKLYAATGRDELCGAASVVLAESINAINKKVDHQLFDDLNEGV